MWHKNKKRRSMNERQDERKKRSMEVTRKKENINECIDEGEKNERK